MSFLSACYSLRESLKKKSIHPSFEDKLKDWWQERENELKNASGLLHRFERFMNTEKHGGAVAGQKSDIDIEAAALMTSLIVTNYPLQADPNTLALSAEGAFMTAHAGTPMERRYPVGIHEAKYEVVVSNPPSTHLGKDVTGATFLQMFKKPFALARPRRRERCSPP